MFQTLEATIEKKSKKKKKYENKNKTRKRGKTFKQNENKYSVDIIFILTVLLYILYRFGNLKSLPKSYRKI